jgi:glucose-1-phosphate cytidylyltransferase
VVTHFGEKNQIDVGWINGGFFMFNSGILDYLQSDEVPFEQGPMNQLVLSKELMTSQHFGFWQPMDTLREKNLLEELSKLPIPPWLEIH